MRRTSILRFRASAQHNFHSTRKLRSEPIVRIVNGTFYRHHPSSNLHSNQDNTPNTPLFPNLDFDLPSSSKSSQHWAILSPSSLIRTTFLQVLRGQLLCFPPTARTYPYLSSPSVKHEKSRLRNPSSAIEYVGFDVERKAYGGAYLSARYESLKEDTDFNLQRYLTGITTLNPGEEELKAKSIDAEVMRRVMRDLELEKFLEKPVSLLSNGQSRRARIGKALLAQPLVLCLDAPFIGLDPIVTRHISELLHRLADANAPRVVLALRPQDTTPEWVTHLVYADENGEVKAIGPKDQVLELLKQQHITMEESVNSGLIKNSDVEEVNATKTSTDPSSRSATLSRDGYPHTDPHILQRGEPIVEMNGVRIAYGTNSVLGDWQQTTSSSITTPPTRPGLHWTIHRAQRWGIFGPNGSGKTTLLSLVTSDHPQTYSAPIKLFGRSRLPEPGQPGITIFEVQARMGHASPEVHALFPKRLSVRRALESAWSDTPITVPRMGDGDGAKVDACLRWFGEELNPLHSSLSATTAARSNTDEMTVGESHDLHWASTTLFGEISFSAQRVLLFLRAVIRNPDIVILDEAFSGMDTSARDKCLLFLSHGQAMKFPSLSSTTSTPSSASRTNTPQPIHTNKTVVVPGLQSHQALLVVSHAREEVPGCVRDWICLPEPGMGGPRFGKFDGPVEMDGRRWDEVWEGKGG